MNAYVELLAELKDSEQVECIIFGEYGWGAESKQPAPEEGHMYTLDEARPILESFSFYGSFGTVTCYAVRIWTNKRIFWVTQYDGSTNLSSTIRYPEEGYIPDMPGG